MKFWALKMAILQIEKNAFFVDAPIVRALSDKVAVDVNQSASLVCVAHAIPAPSFAWFNGTFRIDNGGRISIGPTLKVGQNTYQTALNISNIQHTDFANFTCNSRNTIGNNSAVIGLMVKSRSIISIQGIFVYFTAVPNAPQSLKLLSKTWESMELSWKLGFDGGHQQQLMVTYSSPGQPTHQTPVAPPRATRFNLTGLYPNTTYTVQVFGKNLLGRGKLSRSITDVTRGENHCSSRNVTTAICNKLLNKLSHLFVFKS